jgi:hypothetical protein
MTVTSMDVLAADPSGEYQAAVAEFDRLWETCAAKQHPERMMELLDVIEDYEQSVARANRSP